MSIWRSTSPTRAVPVMVLGLCLVAWAGTGPDREVDATPAVDAQAGALWIAPDPGSPGAASPIALAVADLAAGRAEAAIAPLAAAKTTPLVGGYALLHLGRAHMALGQHDAAASVARDLLAREPEGALGEAAHWLAIDAADATGDLARAMPYLEALIARRPSAHEQAHLRLGRAALAAGRRDVAFESFRRLYYEYALSAEAVEAEQELTALDPGWRRPSTATYELELGRAQRFFGARRYADARKTFESIRPAATREDRVLIDLRLAQCEYHLGRYTTARTALRRFLDAHKTATLRPEAEYYYLSTQEKLGQDAAYLGLVRTFVDTHPGHELAARPLDDLGTHYILNDDDASAAKVFADLWRRWPEGPHGPRAAWKAGWWAYRQDDFAETVRIFEAAADLHRRADYRPSWLYWAARAREQLGERDRAIAGHRRVIEFYRNSYYGRQSTLEIERLTTPAGASPVAPARRALPPSIVPGDLPPNAPLVKALLEQGLYDDAIAELRRVQRDSGSSPLVEATIGLALNRKGELRPAITAMRRAYPQFMAEGGELLPVEILRVIFPIDHWDLITSQARARRLDPFLMTALVAQESTFQADVRSAANAWGLMQVLPSTGRRFAASMGIRPFSTRRLTEPEVNVRIGMTYFSQLIEEFEDAAPALASYNAGEHRVRRWLAERPGIDRDEFIDDIPFPETQNYVKRILGTAEDYRILYSGR
jgi:soluble lytic murein transglycosylase